MHLSVFKFTMEMINKYHLNRGHILEIGSFNVNGTVKTLFTDCGNYTGVDIIPGKDVDEVYDPHEGVAEQFTSQSWYDGEYYTDKFDMIVCTEVLEHAESPWTLLWDVNALLRSGGYFLLTARGVDTHTNKVCHEHNYPADYWRFMPQSVPLLHKEAGCEVVEYRNDPELPGFLSLGKRL